MKATDMLGNEIKVGSLLAYPLTAGRSANMGVYKVLEIRWGEDRRHVGPGRYDYGNKPVPKIKAKQLESTYHTSHTDRPSTLAFADVRGIVITGLPGTEKIDA